MHNDLPRDGAYIARLQTVIHDAYGIDAVEITPAKRGYYGETWKISGTKGNCFLKMDFLPFHQKRFLGGLSVIEYLCERGIDFVGKIVKTRNGSLYARFDAGVMGLFEWIEGENVETDQTKIPEYQMLCKVYPMTKPGLEIPTATFSDEAATSFYAQWEALKNAPKSEANLAVLSIFKRFQTEIAHCALRLAQFAQQCQNDGGDFYLTHGDAGGNFYVGKERNYIFDWDEAMYAPLERDAWVMGCYDWARKLFNDTLKENGIPYQLRMERLAYYCYHMYFFYLGEFLMVHPLSDQSQSILEYLENGWAKYRVGFADTL